MAPALVGSFTFTDRDTLADLIMVANELLKKGRSPLLRFVRSREDEIMSVAMDIGPEIGADPTLVPPEDRSPLAFARQTEMAVVGGESFEVPAGLPIREPEPVVVDDRWLARGEK